MMILRIYESNIRYRKLFCKLINIKNTTSELNEKGFYKIYVKNICRKRMIYLFLVNKVEFL